MEKYVAYLVEWLRKRVKESHCNGLIVGVSGGIDSAVVANLVKRAFPDDSLALIMPCLSKQEDVDHGLIVVKDCQINYQIIDLNDVYQQLTNEITQKITVSTKFELAKANTKARLRMASLYAIAQNYGYLVCGTDNACEWYTGYFTKYGDGGVDIAPLIQLTKSQVYEMARYFTIDEKIIVKAPSAGLLGEQTDEQEMQVTYQELEAFMNGVKVSEKARERISFLHQASEHKRKGIVFPDKKVSDLK